MAYCVCVLQYDELEGVLRDSGVLAQTEKAEQLEVSLNWTECVLRTVVGICWMQRICWMHINLMHMHFSLMWVYLVYYHFSVHGHGMFLAHIYPRHWVDCWVLKKSCIVFVQFTIFNVFDIVITTKKVKGAVETVVLVVLLLAITSNLKDDQRF